MTDEASRGSSANHAIRRSRTAGATDSRTSALPRKSRVAPSNSGRSSLAETTAVRPPQSRSAPRSASVLVSSCRSRAKGVEPFRPWPWPVDGDPHAAVGFQRDVDVFGATGEYLVDRPVGHLEHLVVQPGLTSRAHVHPRPLPDGFPALQHLNGGGGVRARGVTQEAPSSGCPADPQLRPARTKHQVRAIAARALMAEWRSAGSRMERGSRTPVGGRRGFRQARPRAHFRPPRGLRFRPTSPTAAVSRRC